MPAIEFELKAKKRYATSMIKLLDFDPFTQKNPMYLNAIFKAISTATFASIQATLVTTADTGLGSAPPVPGAGVGKLKIDEGAMHSKIYSLVRESVKETIGRESGHDIFPPSRGNSGEVLLALIESFTVTAQELYQRSPITSTHAGVYLGVGKIKPAQYLGSVTPLQPNIMSNQILAMTPMLRGQFWPKFVEAYSRGFFETVTQKSTGEVAIVGVCVPSVTMVCAIPSTGTGTGKLIVV